MTAKIASRKKEEAKNKYVDEESDEETVAEDSIEEENSGNELEPKTTDPLPKNTPIPVPKKKTENPTAALILDEKKYKKNKR